MAAQRSVAIALEGVSKRFGRAEAVRDVSLGIGEGEFFSLLGPSGCGKTTTLRMIAGFEVPDEGRVLLQERDEHAPIDPERWGLSGGHLEPGEDPEAGAYREVEEETGVHLEPGTLELFDVFEVFHPVYGSVDQVHVFVGRVDLTDDDIDCREGRQIVFVAPGRARALDLTMTGVLAVPAFLDSTHYARLSRAVR